MRLADPESPARFQTRQAVDLDQLDQGGDERGPGLGLERFEIGRHAAIGCNGKRHMLLLADRAPA